MSETPEQLQERISGCRICADQPDGTPLPHQPRPVVRLSSAARLCLAGQAPGLRVHETGEPFNDASGDRLRDWMGVDRPTFYDRSRIAIVPMGFCFPGYDNKKSDLPPRRECRAHWHEQVYAAMPQLELVLTIGIYAQDYHLGSRRRKTMTETVAAWREFLDAKDSPAVLPLPHPSWRNTGWLKRNRWFEDDVLPELKRRVADLVRK